MTPQVERPGNAEDRQQTRLRLAAMNDDPALGGIAAAADMTDDYLDVMAELGRDPVAEFRAEHHERQAREAALTPWIALAGKRTIKPTSRSASRPPATPTSGRPRRPSTPPAPVAPMSRGFSSSSVSEPCPAIPIRGDWGRQCSPFVRAVERIRSGDSHVQNDVATREARRDLD